MSFLKDKTYQESTGNLDFEDNDYEEEEQAEQKCSSPSTAPQPRTTEPPPAPVNRECEYSIAMPAPLVDSQDPVSKAEWLFLLSVLEYFGKITNEALKSKLRLESLCLMHNFRTGNKEAMDFVCIPKDGMLFHQHCYCYCFQIYVYYV